MVLMTSKTSLQKWSGVFLFPSVSPVFFQIGTVTYQHRLRFRWRGFMYEFLPLIRKARTRCDLCRALHDFARLRLTSQFLPAGNYGWRKCIQRGCLKNTSSVSFKVSGILVKQPPVCLQYLVFPAVAVVHFLHQAYPCIAQRSSDQLYDVEAVDDDPGIQVDNYGFHRSSFPVRVAVHEVLPDCLRQSVFKNSHDVMTSFSVVADE